MQRPIKKSWVFLFLILSLLAIFTASIFSDIAVEFNDINLEVEIREMLNNYSKPIYRSKLMDLYELDLSGKHITDLSGLEHARNLEILNLADNNIKDVSPLSTLTSLHILNLQNNEIASLEAINFDSINHLNLIELYLDNNFIGSKEGESNHDSGIEAISNYHNIEILSLNFNFVSNISPLLNLSKMRVLKLRGNQIHNIDGLGACSRLENLDLSRNNIHDISTIKELFNLKKLNLRENDIEDISPLQNLTQLEYLNLHTNTKIKSVIPISNLTNLTTLILRNVPISGQVWVFKDMEKLSRLNVRNCKISDFSIIAELMAKGILQDNEENLVFATINLRDNELIVNNNDPLASIRPYWENVTNREPTFLPHFSGLVKAPIFSQKSGFFTDQFTLYLSSENSGLDIYYTLDGSDPNPDHVHAPKSLYQKTFKYSEPLLIKSRSGDKNIYSTINTTHGDNAVPYMPPKSEVFKATVVRAIAYDHENDTQSEIVTQTYFVDENIHTLYSTLAVVSLTADYDALFGDEFGILNTGLGENIYYSPKTRVPANLEFFETDRSIGFQGQYEIKLHGNTSVANPQKGLHVIANSWVGEELIQYPIFKDSLSKANQLTEFKRFILRAWGTALNWPVFFSDAYHQTLLADSDLDIQDYRPVVLFINGEYWGLYEMREAIKNLEYFQSHYYNWQPVPLDILELGTIDFIDEGDPQHWFAMLKYVENNDIQDPDVYAYVQSQMDIDNFILYMAHCVFMGKKDWPIHNEAMWRPRTVDGKWRWIQFDMDQGLRPSVDAMYDMVNHVTNEEIHPHPLFLQLFKNDTFRHLFFNTFADLSNTYFLTSVEVDHFLAMANELDPYIPEFQARWNYDFDWEENKALALDLIKNRRTRRISQMLEHFDELSGVMEVTLLTDATMGKNAINSITITSDTPGVTDPNYWQGNYFQGIPINIQAIPNPGYRFVNWEGSIELDSDLQSITIHTNQSFSLKANFEPINN
ncbi:MAG: hypothetical protein GX142_04890 [Chloroflexi bacterium]|jgi:Leucine-rich repeat (LRR) protein|nr:hypothetical protein [Chloroflexota bacterium]